MADDIKITGQGGNSESNGGSKPAQKAGVKKQNTEDKPVIDLRELDKPAAKQGSSQASAQQGVQQGAQKATAKPAKTGGVNLEDEAMMASQNVMGPPEKFVIPTLVKEKFPDLIQLIKETESMNDEERDYWFQILPIMTEEQIKKFRDILLNEKKQLNRLDKEYEQELNRLNEKHMIEWKEFESKEKRKVLTEAEQKSEAEEKAAEEELMKRLSQT